MKKVIREGVFETNSSSTHSVVLKKKTNEKPEEESTLELHTPFFKTLFLIGLFNHALKYESFSEDFEDEELDGDDLFNEILEENGIEPSEDYSNVKGNFDKYLCEKFKNAVINEYITSQGITKEEFDKAFNESEFTYEGRCECRDFFDDDVLSDCTCQFDGFYAISSAFGLSYLTTDEQFNEKAKEYLSDDYKMVLQEFWCGCCLINKKEII